MGGILGLDDVEVPYCGKNGINMDSSKS